MPLPPENRAVLIAEIFDAAIECDTTQRLAFIEERCGSDPDLRAEVESLLRAAKQPAGFLEHTPVVIQEQRGAFAAGDVIDNYEIVSLIGKGGMGEVYLASDRQLGRSVALKLVRRGIDSEEIVHRFEHEQRLLAGLNHPNIAQLHGAGVTGDGLPFFAMEYIPGTRLDQYCREKALSLAQRLELFTKICGAVHHAHQHLVVHRDIKPSNILVTAEGEPKLLDFGIAKALDAATNTPLEQTVTLHNVMTPEYASPEHVRGDPITTASDVYSLGVLLYELLTGSKPYRITTHTPIEIARIVTEKEPARPSLAFSPNSQLLNPKSLRGDLDNIVLMAMRKEPKRRYSSAAQLAADIHRHFDGLPVAARRDTLAYRASKFIGRNRVAAVAAIVVLLSILAGLVVAFWEAEQARRQRDLARREKAKAERINQFLQTMLSFSNQSLTSVSPVSQRKDVTVNEMLDQITPQVEKELAHEPAVRGQILRTIGSAYASQGRYDAAEKNLRAALALQMADAGEVTSEAAATMSELGVLSYRQAHLQEAAELLEKAVAFYRRERERGSAAGSAASLALALDYLGVVKFYQADVNRALTLLREALAISSSPSLPETQRTIVTFNKADLAGVLIYSGQIEEGAKLAEEAVTEYRRLPGPPRWELAVALGLRGVVLLTRQRLDEAEKALVESEQILRQTLGESNTYMAGIRDRRAALYFLKNELGPAETLAREALALYEASSPPGSLPASISLWTLGDILLKADRPAEAEACYRRALAIHDRQPAINFVSVSTIRTYLSYSLLVQNRFDEAEAAATQALTEARQHLGPDHPNIKTAEVAIAKIREARLKSSAR